jgi:hypothetical protein
MIKLDRGWLKAKHHSFSEHGNATRMGWGSLRAWNDEEIARNTGSIRPATPTWKS